MIVDASVLVAANSGHESAHGVARLWYEQAIRSDLAAPAIVLAEVAAAISRATGNESLAESVVANLVRSPINFVAVDQELAAEAATIAIRQRIRGCDAIYVALAARLARPLVTFDGEQLSRSAPAAEARRPGAEA